MLERWLVALHVVSNLVWVGASAAVGVLLAYRAAGISAKARGELALRIHRVLAAPAFGLSFLLGAARLLGSLEYYFRATHFMHAKLPIALIAIGMHHVLGSRAKKLAAGGEAAERGGAATLTAVLLVCAALAAILAIVEPF